DLPCGAQTCGGCCLGGACEAGNRAVACGARGQSCGVCTTGLACNSGACIPSSTGTCDPTNCTGCCDGATCRPATEISCGVSGMKCITCSGATPICDFI